MEQTDLTAHRGLACKAIHRMLGWKQGHPDFEDAIQECYLWWWMHRHKWQPGRGWKWSSWAIKVAQGRVRQYGRTCRRRGLTNVGDRAAVEQAPVRHQTIHRAVNDGLSAARDYRAGEPWVGLALAELQTNTTKT